VILIMKKNAAVSLCALLLISLRSFPGSVFGGAPPTEASPLHEKAKFFQQDLLDKHWLDGLYVSIVPSAPSGTKLPHTVNEPGNVIHAGVWTGRYLGGVGYQYASTKDPWVRKHGGEILKALRILQEVTGKPGLLARGYVKGHGPVEDWERDGRDSVEWHQGEGNYADYRWYGDVSVDNLNAVLYGYSIYYDLAADAAQKKMIAHDVDRLMTHLLENHCRIVDVDGEVTQWGHVGIDPDPVRDEYYQKQYGSFLRRTNSQGVAWQPSLRSSLMLLPDLLIAHHVTGQPRYLDFYRRVDRLRDAGPFSLERLARVNHSSEGQAYEALYNLIRYEHDPELLQKYRPWVAELWEMNWMEGNALFAYMSATLLPEYHAPKKPGSARAAPVSVAHGEEGLRLALETLKLFPVDRVFRPVMNSLRSDIELNPNSSQRNGKQSAKPIPAHQRPLDNEYAWKGNPYQLDGWLKPAVTVFQFACDDPLVAWFSDGGGRIFRTLNGGNEWREMTSGLMGARVQNILASSKRTFVLHAQTDKGLFVTRDGGASWRPAPAEDKPGFPAQNFKEWQRVSEKLMIRVNDTGDLVRTTDGGKTEATCMNGWRIPRAFSVFVTPRGILASGPGGCYQSGDANHWTEMKLWREEETGAADFLHAYWMGRYYGFIHKND
jgi:hypothetical protein